MPFIAPAWRDESLYPKPGENHNLLFWAWQFLRRNSKYQAEWQAYIDVLNHKAKRFPALAGILDSDSWRHGKDTAEMELVGGDGQLDVRHTELSEQNCLRSRAAAIAEKWGIEKIVNPASPDLPHWSGFDINGGMITVLTHSVPDHLDDNFLTPQIDLRLPVEVLEAQFKAILAERARLIKHRGLVPYKGRPHRATHLYPQYLRVLDALGEDESIAVIASALLPHQDCEGAKKTVRNWKNAATKIRDETFRLLPAYQVIAERKAIKAPS